MWREAPLQTGAAFPRSKLSLGLLFCRGGRDLNTFFLNKKYSKETPLLQKSQSLKPNSIAYLKNREKYLILLVTFSCLGRKYATFR